MIRVGLIGVGTWGGKVLRTLTEDLAGEAEVVWTAGRHDWPTKLGKGKADAVVVAVPPDAQPMIAKTVLEAGLSVFLEKPLALDTLSARQIHEAAALRGLPVAVDHVWLFSPEWELLKQRVKGQEFKYVEFWSGGKGPQRSWPVAHPGLWDWAPHDVAMMLDLLDEEMPQSYEAQEVTPGVYHLHLGYGNIANRKVYISTGNGRDQGYPRAAYVRTEEGLFVLDSRNGKTRLMLDAVEVPIAVFHRPLTQALRLWLKAVRGDQWDERIGTTLGLKVVEVVEQCADKLREKKR